MRLFVLLLVLSACSSAEQSWENMSVAERTSVLNKITDDCKIARSTFNLRQNGELWVQPDPNEKYDRVDCALGKLKNVVGLSKIGFVGNEAYQSDDRPK